MRGAKPADIPVEQPTKFSLTVKTYHGKDAWSRNAACARNE
jgi:hypothetical protein